MSKNISIALLLAFACTRTVAAPASGFYLPDSLFEFTMRYKTVDGLIVLPVMINDSVRVNLILDTGCRNLLLFGKRFEHLFLTEKKPVQFSGLGSGKPLNGSLSLNNSVSIEAVTGKRIPIIIVPNKNLFATLPNVDGIVGYEIFSKFEIELNFPQQRITFRTAPSALPLEHFQYFPLKIVDSKPVLECTITTEGGLRKIDDLLIDTGSSLGLIYSVQEKSLSKRESIGRGLNGFVIGEKSTTDKLSLSNFEFTNVATSIAFSNKTYASIGMDILKDHIVILNYSRSYVAFRKEGRT